MLRHFAIRGIYAANLNLSSNKHSRQRILLIIVLVFFEIIPLASNAQLFDSLSVYAGTQANAASAQYQPLWLVANTFGTIQDRQTDLTSYIKITNKHTLVNLEDLDEDLLVRKSQLFLNYGASLYNNNYFKKVFLQEAYLSIVYKKWSAMVGKFENRERDLDADLSSGSLGVSTNARPIPMIRGAVNDYENIPFTHGWLQFKGSLAHGWFGNHRYMKDAFYHEKTFYMRLGPEKIKFYGGLQHYAEWGGHRGNWKLDRSFKGFMNVLLVREANDGSVPSGYRPSRAGDQRGLLEAGIFWNDERYTMQGYAQMPFESGEEIDPRNRSVLAGLVWKTKKEDIRIKKVLIEILYTKQMNDFVGVGQRQTYYNNGSYKTGWEYEDRVVGTPLFMNLYRVSKYFSNIHSINWDGPNNTIPGNGNIVNNMIFAIHAGVQAALGDNMLFKSMLTYSRNYGSLSSLSKELFSPHKIQFFTLQDFLYQIPESKWQWHIQLGIDFGALGANAGVSIGCRYALLN
jgi:hypothetical protein